MSETFYEAGTGAIRSNDGAKEQWELISGASLYYLVNAMDIPRYRNFTIIELIHRSVDSAYAFLGCDQLTDASRIDALAVGWAYLATAIQKMDMPPAQLDQFLASLESWPRNADGCTPHYPDYALRRLALTCHEGAQKYGEENWHHGFEIKSLLNRGIRHMVRWTNGDRTEDHPGHGMWSYMASVHTWIFRRDDLCRRLLGPDYSITDELREYHIIHRAKKEMVLV